MKITDVVTSAWHHTSHSGLFLAIFYGTCVQTAISQPLIKILTLWPRFPKAQQYFGNQMTFSCCDFCLEQYWVNRMSRDRTLYQIWPTEIIRYLANLSPCYVALLPWPMTTWPAPRSRAQFWLPSDNASFPLFT